MKFTDQEIIEGIKTAQNNVLLWVREECFPIVRHHVKTNSGTLEDSEDIFQEAQIILYRKLRYESMVLECSVKKFLLAVSKKLWLMRLRSKSKTTLTDSIDEKEDYLQENTLDLIITHERLSLYEKYFDNLSEGCKKVLTLFFKGLKMKEIASKLNFSSEEYARKRKHNCQQGLINKIKSDPVYMELTDSDIIPNTTS